MCIHRCNPITALHRQTGPETMYVNAVRTLTKSSRHMPVTLLFTVHFEPFSLFCDKLVQDPVHAVGEWGMFFFSVRGLTFILINVRMAKKYMYDRGLYRTKHASESSETMFSLS